MAFVTIGVHHVFWKILMAVYANIHGRHLDSRSMHTMALSAGDLRMSLNLVKTVSEMTFFADG
jgi:hypothetical protein